MAERPEIVNYFLEHAAFIDKAELTITNTGYAQIANYIVALEEQRDQWQADCLKEHEERLLVEAERDDLAAKLLAAQGELVGWRQAGKRAE